MRLIVKAKYTRRWKGKDGKWNYEYGKPVSSGMVRVRVRNTLGKIEEVVVPESDPLAQLQVKIQREKERRQERLKQAGEKLSKLGLETVADIDKKAREAGVSRYEMLVSLVGEGAANIALRVLEVQQWR